ncbi:hypothetical protein VTN77DRAFT_1587 [Rasamsonia byssochlamydoides]|uniref:uncharacterized protein n=1 Tax=Rasamsonia byssochlamydoides TaxID=89139 RepID=UPI00374430B5
MFSEYASRFLAQSQSRIAARPEEDHWSGGDRHRRSNNSNSRFPASRSYLHRAMGNPYQPVTSQLSHFPFASRSLAQPAPLFYSATDEFREEDDEHEHEREIADYYALQRSRRHFGNSHLEESSELDEDGRESEASRDHQLDQGPGLGRGNGIKSSWRDERTSARSRNSGNVFTKAEEEYNGNHESPSGPQARFFSVDIGPEDTLSTEPEDFEHDSHPPDFVEEDPPIQQFRKQPEVISNSLQSNSAFMPQETDKQTLLEHPRPPSSTGSSVPPSMTQHELDPPVHDAFWGHLFLLSLSGLFATAFLVYLHTSLPSEGKWRWGDTIYITIHRSYFLLGIYTLVSIFVSLLWLALLRSYLRVLVHGMLVIVPVILYSFSLYPFISSFKGSWHGESVQDKVMRWGSIFPFIFATLWIYAVIQGRHATGKAVSILEFACRILAANPALLALGLLTVGVVVSWTWLWMLMFTRVFLGGHLSSSNSFIIDVSSWWLSVYFVLVFLWSLGVISGIQRAVTAATVSQWYFHRLAIPAPTSFQVVRAALVHALTTLFGTICLSTLLALLLRLPLIVLPRRISSIITLCAYSLIPTPIAALTNPLALTYAAIHSQPLARSARGLTQMAFLSSTTTTSLHPPSFSRKASNSAPLLPYRLSKLILHASRFAMSLALGFGGWVTAARSLDVTDSSTVRGSLYAYIVGLIAAVIGWGILGSMEGVLACIVDAAIVCWASEVGNSGREARYCREAGWLFGEDRDAANVRRWDRV